MQTKTKNRLISVLTTLVICTIGVYFILSNLNDNIVFFYPPSETHKIKSSNENVRVGGLVKIGSITKHEDNKITFIITDHVQDLEVEYKGLLPALFREKQGIVAEGNLTHPNLFRAKRLLAKHDENYIPPELVHINNEGN